MITTFRKEGGLDMELDVREKIKEEIARQKEMIAKSAANMSRVPDHLKAYQEKAFDLMQKELKALEDLAERSNI